MNAIAIPPVIHRSKRRRWPWILLLLVLLSPCALLGLAALGVASLFHVSSDTRAVRRTLIQSSGADWQPLIGIHANRLALGATRAGLSFIELAPEVRVALRSVRGAEVTVSRLGNGNQAPDCAAMQSAADACLKARGWERILAARKGQQLVAAYVPQECDSFRRMQCVVVVLTGHELVVASVRADLSSLLDYLPDRYDFPAAGRRLVQR